MNYDQLAEHIDKKIDQITDRVSRIEDKLDRYLEQQSEQKADISWIKGYIKVSVSTLLALSTGLITTIISMYNK